jgi:hypothetical protein
VGGKAGDCHPSLRHRPCAVATGWRWRSTVTCDQTDSREDLSASNALAANHPAQRLTRTARHSLKPPSEALYRGNHAVRSFGVSGALHGVQAVDQAPGRDTLGPKWGVSRGLERGFGRTSGPRPPRHSSACPEQVHQRIRGGPARASAGEAATRQAPTLRLSSAKSQAGAGLIGAERPTLDAWDKWVDVAR